MGLSVSINDGVDRRRCKIFLKIISDSNVRETCATTLPERTGDDDSHTEETLIILCFRRKDCVQSRESEKRHHKYLASEPTSISCDVIHSTDSTVLSFAEIAKNFTSVPSITYFLFSEPELRRRVVERQESASFAGQRWMRYITRVVPGSCRDGAVRLFSHLSPPD